MTTEEEAPAMAAWNECGDAREFACRVLAAVMNAMMDRFGSHGPCLGIDVGESSRWALAVDAGGGIVIDRPLPNRRPDVDAPLGEAGKGALAVVGQRDSVGSPVVRRCRTAHGGVRRVDVH